MNFKSILLIMGLVVVSFSTAWSQAEAYRPSKETGAHQVMRNAKQTYVHLQWMPTAGATSYEVMIRSLGDREWQRFSTSETNFTVPNLTVPAKYEWSVIPKGNAITEVVSYNIKQFNTAYNAAQKVDREVFSILMGWDGSKEEGMTLGQYMRANRPASISEEKVETFIQDYYGGNEPLLLTDETCNCQVFLQDNFIPDPSDDFPPIVEASYIRYGTANGTGGREKLGSNKYQQRKLESNYIVSYGAAKDMSFNLEARMTSGTPQQHYTDAKTDQTFIVAKFVCTGSDCSGCQDEQRFDVWAKYNVDMQFTEWLAGPGAYGMSSQDATMFMEISKDGVESIGELVEGIMREKDVSINDDHLTNWINALQTTTELANTIFNFIPTEDEDEEQDIIDDIFNVVENWVNAINTPAYVTNVNEGIDVTSKQELWKHQTCIEPNGWRCFAVLSTGKIGYTDAWGKKGIAINGWKNVAPDIKISGYQQSDIGMSISAVYDPYPDDSECASACCFNSMGKWLYYSMRGDDFSVRSDIRGLFDDIGWTYADDFVHFDNPPAAGSDLGFYQGNADLSATNFALITAEGDCCEADPVDLALDFQVECVAVDCGPHPPHDDDKDKEKDDTIDDSSFIPDPPNPGNDCYRLDFDITVLGDLSLDHVLQVMRFHPDTGPSVVWTNFAGQSPTGQYIFSSSPYYSESIYYIVLQIEDSCGNLKSKTFNLDISCDGVVGGGGDGPDGPYDPDGPGDSPGTIDGDFIKGSDNTNTTTSQAADQDLETGNTIGNAAGLNTNTTVKPTFEVFPNPAKDLLNVRLSETFRNEGAVIELFSANGQLLQTIPVIPGKDVQKLSVANMTDGLYIVRVRTASGLTEVKRVVIQ